MGNNTSANTLPPNRMDTSIPPTDIIFKVDNINSYGCKHASAKIELTNDNLSIKQKHRQSLHIPLQTIKRYGLDGSIFILECGRQAPLGQARYAFRCKQARRLVDCLDQRITIRSKQLSEEQRRGTVIPSPSDLTNLSAVPHHHHHHRRRQRTQSDQAGNHRVPSSILFSSSSSSSISLTSKATFSYRNSEPNISENYLAFDTLPSQIDTSDSNREGQFLARLKQPVQKSTVPELNYIEFKAEPTSAHAFNKEGRYIYVLYSISYLILDKEHGIVTISEESDHQSMKESPAPQSRKRTTLLSFFHHQPQSKSNRTSTHSPPLPSKFLSETTSINTPYVYIDHEKTTTLTEIAHERLQQHQQARRIDT